MKHIFFIYFFLITTVSSAQFANIVLDETNGTSSPPSEPSIAINPKDPDNIVAAAMPDKIYITQDGGKTWSKKQLGSTFKNFGDPVVISDRKGDFYLFHLAGPAGAKPASDEFSDRIAVQKSADGGESWDKGNFFGYNPSKALHKERATTDRKGNIYVTWTQFDKYGSEDPEDKSNIFFSSSTNGGKKWSEPVRLNNLSGNCLDNDLSTEGAIPAVDHNGKIYVTWAYNNKLYLDRSYDNGKTWLRNDIELMDQPGGSAYNIPGLQRSNGMPVLISDNSQTKLRGMLHLSWSDQINGEHDTDIWFSSSYSGGDLWTGRTRVNDDAPGKHQFMSWMAQDVRSGYIYIVFYDRRNYDDNRTDVYLAYSKNGGKSFTNIKISESPFIPDEDHSFGDYINIDAYNGTIVPVWTRMDNGKTKIITTVIKQEELDKLEAQQ